MENIKKRIVVLGGSFNPPTKAHQAIMKSAMNAISATKGVYVPSSDAYVSRKMSKVKCDNQVYSENDRAKMLILCSNEETTISIVEYGDDGKGHTYETLCKVQASYPDSEIWFVVGDDKLDIMTRWHNHDKLFEKFKFVVLTRGDVDVANTIKNNSVLSKYADNFKICNSPAEIDGISSTRCRQLINDKSWNVLETYVDKKVVDFLKRGIPMRDVVFELNFLWDDGPDSKTIILTVPKDVTDENVIATLKALHDELCDDMNGEDIYAIGGVCPETLMKYVCEKRENWHWREVDFALDLH